MSPPALIVAPPGGVALDATLAHRVPAVALAGGAITAWGESAALRKRHPTASLLTNGMVAMPGFRDPHLHLLRMASARVAVDCSPAVAPDLGSLLARLRASAASTPPGGWLRAAGYDHRALAERRHPIREEMDRAVPDRPLVLRHRSGHASLLNSYALQRLGLENGEHTSGAPSACQRDPQGRLSGLVIEGDGLLRARGLPRLDDAALARAVADASNELATHGVTWLCDAGAENDNATRALFMRLAAAGCILQRWALLQGIQAFLSEGGDLSDAFVGVKLVVSSSSGAPEPDVEELTRQLEAVHAAGVPAAVHAVEPDELVVALSAFESVFARRGRGAIRHRIEHASACPPDLAAWIARLRLVVVTQPAFVAAFGDRYLERAHVPPEWLYPCRALRAAGIPVAASSDAPFGPCAPLAAVRAASRRRSQTGHGVGLGQRLGLDAAFSLYATSAVASESGRLHLGGPADIVVLDREPLVDGVGGTSDELVQTTIAAGRIVFERV